MTDIATLRRIIRQESPSRLELGTVIAADLRGSKLLSVRLSGGKVCSRALACIEGLSVGDRVLVARLEGEAHILVLSKIESEHGSYLGKRSILAPPASLAALPIPGAIKLSWDDYPGEDLCWQVRHNSSAADAGATDALVTGGSHYFYNVVDEDADAGAPVARYFRVRAIRWISDNNVMYSAWSAWVNTTSVTFDGRYRTETELQSVANAEGASFIGIEDAGAHYAGTDVEAALQEIAGGGGVDLADLGSYARGSVIRGGATAWEAHAAEGDHLILVGDGTDAMSKAFDWDDMAAGAGADMVHDHSVAGEGGAPQLDWDTCWVDAVHDHSAAGEGGEVPLASLGSYAQGGIMIGGAADWTTLAPPGLFGSALVSNLASFIWNTAPFWAGLHTFNAGASIAAGQGLTLGDASWLGIAGNELLTVNAAGNFTFSGITSLVVPDGCWVGADAACSFVFNSGGGIVSVLDNFGVGTADADGKFTVEAALTDTVDDETACHILYRGDDNVNYWKTRLKADGEMSFDYNAAGTWYECMRLYRNGKMYVHGSAAGDFITFFNDGDAANFWGIKMICGADDHSGVTNYLFCEDGDGDYVGAIRNNNGTFEIHDGSDKRFKKNVRPTAINGLDIILNLPVIDHEWKAHDGPGRRAGLCAQDAQGVFPDMVGLVEEDKDQLTLAPSRLIFVLVKAMQEQQAQIEALQGRA